MNININNIEEIIFKNNYYLEMIKSTNPELIKQYYQIKQNGLLELLPNFFSKILKKIKKNEFAKPIMGLGGWRNIIYNNRLYININLYINNYIDNKLININNNYIDNKLINILNNINDFPYILLSRSEKKLKLLMF